MTSLPPKEPATLGRSALALLASRKTVLHLQVIILTIPIAIGLAWAAVTGRISWPDAFKYASYGLAIVGGSSAVNSWGIAKEDTARIAATTPAPVQRIDASSSVTNVAADPEATGPNKSEPS